jgi:hypothetical protein
MRLSRSEQHHWTSTWTAAPLPAGEVAVAETAGESSQSVELGRYIWAATEARADVGWLVGGQARGGSTTLRSQGTCGGREVTENLWEIWIERKCPYPF